jgi:hypothetical protein
VRASNFTNNARSKNLIRHGLDTRKLTIGIFGTGWDAGPLNHSPVKDFAFA